MASTTFVDLVTVINTAWLNDVDALVWDVFGGATTAALARTALAIQPTASPTFTGTVTIPTPFTLGAVSVTATGTELNYVAGVTSAIQTQFTGKAALAGATFTGAVAVPAGATGAQAPQAQEVARLATANIFTARQEFRRDDQSDYSTAAIESYNGVGDAYISLNAGGVTVTSIRHTRGGAGISVRTAANALAPLACSALTASTGIVGTTVNDAAAAGYVGEYVEGTGGPTNAPVTGTYSEITSITLTEGDWDVSLNCVYTLNGATAVSATVGIGTVSGNSATGVVAGDTAASCGAPGAAYNLSLVVPPKRVSIAGSTTYYLKVTANYSAGTPQFQGRLSARRVR